MRDDKFNKSKLSWTKSLVKKWLNIRSKAEDFQADVDNDDDDDDLVADASPPPPPQDVDEEWNSSSCTINMKSNSEKFVGRKAQRFRIEPDSPSSSHFTDTHNFKVFVGTWNVAGKSPPPYLNLEDWLHNSSPADIYVLGFQEIVPLNAGNVLGSEDNAPARKWLRLIRRTLNGLPGGGGGGGGHCDPIAELEDGFETSSDLFRRRSFQSSSRSDRTQLQPERRHSVCDRAADSWLEVDDDHNHDCGHGSFSSVDGKSKFCMVASKQMVGIFLTVWIKADLKNAVGNLKVSCVGRGLMGYLGNKGSISISMSLHRTSFCFVCSHLSSGERDGDELRRNSDVMEILRKTRFPRGNSPRTILDHDRIVWLGDLNYRISLSYRYAKALVEMQNWRALLENDQLRLEQRNGRVFEGWNEGKICFPPTYKYSNNSDRYAGENVHPKEKRRTPAWCDRILWCGRGLRQLSYVRGESRFSDHRPVYSVFLAEVESVNRNRIKKSMSYSSSRVEVEELLPFDYYGYNYGYGYCDSGRLSTDIRNCR